MADRLLLCAKLHNFAECVALAHEYHTGIEVQTFAFPPMLTNDWRELLSSYQKHLRDVPGEIALHGPFMDLAGGSLDPLINEVVRERVQQTLHMAGVLGARTLVFHANFIAMIRTPEYREGWTARQVEFWGPLAEQAWAAGHVIALENMWEYDPDIIGNVLRVLNNPGLRACVDVGHTHLFSDVPLAHWLARLNGFVAHVHINNNHGDIDYHRGLDDGVLDYRALMPHLRRLESAPSISLEIEEADDMRRSLDFLRDLDLRGG